MVKKREKKLVIAKYDSRKLKVKGVRKRNNIVVIYDSKQKKYL